MPKHTTERRVNHPARDMFDLVADVERYPEFVPLCQRLVVRGRSQDDAGREVLIADMTIAYKLVKETFTTRVTLDRADGTIRSEYLDGPFHHLDSRWRFTPEDEQSCLVGFTIDYEFKSRVLGAIMGSVFDGVFRRFAEAFEARADALHGRPAAS